MGHTVPPNPPGRRNQEHSPIRCWCDSQLVLCDKHPPSLFGIQQQTFVSHSYILKAASLQSNLWIVSRSGPCISDLPQISDFSRHISLTAKGTQESLQKHEVLLRVKAPNCHTVTFAPIALAKACHMAGPDLSGARLYNPISRLPRARVLVLWMDSWSCNPFSDLPTNAFA